MIARDREVLAVGRDGDRGNHGRRVIDDRPGGNGSRASAVESFFAPSRIQRRISSICSSGSGLPPKGICGLVSPVRYEMTTLFSGSPGVNAAPFIAAFQKFGEGGEREAGLAAGGLMASGAIARQDGPDLLFEADGIRSVRRFDKQAYGKQKSCGSKHIWNHPAVDEL